MMKQLIPFVVIILAFLSCNKNHDVSEPIYPSNQFVSDGIFFDVSSGCPLDTRALSDAYTSYTIVAEKNNIEITLFLVETTFDTGIIKSDTFLSNGALATTAFICEGRVIKYFIWTDAQIIPYSYTGPDTKGPGRQPDETYFDCVERLANEASDNQNKSALNRATCEWIPCETIRYVVALFNCINEEAEDSEEDIEVDAEDDFEIISGQFEL